MIKTPAKAVFSNILYKWCIYDAVDRIIASFEKQEEATQIVAALNAQQPKCKTCGGTKKKPRAKGEKHCRLLLCQDVELACGECPFYIEKEPCPDCPPKAQKDGGFRQKVTRALLDSRSDEQQLKIALKLLWEAAERIEELEKALGALYEHTKNNMQICGINDQAKAALEEKP